MMKKTVKQITKEKKPSIKVFKPDIIQSTTTTKKFLQIGFTVHELSDSGFTTIDGNYIGDLYHPAGGVCIDRLKKLKEGQTLIYKEVAELSCFPHTDKLHKQCELRQDEVYSPDNNDDSSNSENEEAMFYNMDYNTNYLNKFFNGFYFDGKLKFSPFLLEKGEIKYFNLPGRLCSKDNTDTFLEGTISTDRPDELIEYSWFGSIFSIKSCCAWNLFIHPNLFANCFKNVFNANLLTREIMICGYEIEEFKISTYPRRNYAERYIIALAKLYGGVEVTALDSFLLLPPSEQSLYRRGIHTLPKTDNKVFYIAFDENVVEDFWENFAQIKLYLDIEARSLKVKSIITYRLSEILGGSSNLLSMLQWPKYKNLQSNCHIPLLLKPNGVSLPGFAKIVESLSEQPIIFANVKFKLLSIISNELIEHLYPNTANKPYGADWIKYLKSGPCMVLLISLKDNNISNAINYLRMLMIYAREKSNIIWTRNIVHCPSSVEEYERNKLFFTENKLI